MLISQKRQLPWPLNRWHIFDLSSAPTNLNLTKYDRDSNTQRLLPHSSFKADSSTKMATRASDLLQHVRLLLRLTENKYSSALPNLCFSGQFVSKDGCSDLWLADTFYFYLSIATVVQNLTKVEWPEPTGYKTCHGPFLCDSDKALCILQPLLCKLQTAKHICVELFF